MKRVRLAFLGGEDAAQEIIAPLRESDNGNEAPFDLSVDSRNQILFHLEDFLISTIREGRPGSVLFLVEDE